MCMPFFVWGHPCSHHQHHLLKPREETWGKHLESSTQVPQSLEDAGNCSYMWTPKWGEKLVRASYRSGDKATHPEPGWERVLGFLRGPQECQRRLAVPRKDPRASAGRVCLPHQSPYGGTKTGGWGGSGTRSAEERDETMLPTSGDSDGCPSLNSFSKGITKVPCKRQSSFGALLHTGRQQKQRHQEN